jgi:YHS domain-containing protein
MRFTNLMFLSIIITFLFSLNALAQDDKTEKSGCSTVKSCCDKSAAKSEETSAVETVKPWNTVCPVMGNKIDPEVATVEYKGKNYGFCCEGCDDKFSKDPARYSRNLNKDGKKFSKSKS